MLRESQKALNLEICPRDINRLWRFQRRESGFLRTRQCFLGEGTSVQVKGPDKQVKEHGSIRIQSGQTETVEIGF
jgi:hypothetical protein